MAKLSIAKRTPRAEAIAEAAAEASNIQNRKEQAESSKDRGKAIFQHFRDTWPYLFGLEVASNPPPLKIGIFRDIFESGLPDDTWGRTAVNRVLGRWCRRQEYRKQLIRGGPRLGLDGNPAGEITPEEQQQARTELARALAVRKGKKKAPQQPQVTRKPTPRTPTKQPAQNTSAFAAAFEAARKQA